ncbi:unnamed protein product [Schistosoma curassoni]|uniref:Uncharacterized protein n=1 Tax=Schistosoma curassoni TaxID=6186 RepID=A0A183JNJ4_9TREM|nr:unnamed protein product [Schistosoma curassoni]
MYGQGLSKFFLAFWLVTQTIYLKTLVSYLDCLTSYLRRIPMN